MATRSPAQRGRAPQLRKALKKQAPSLAVERELWEAGHDVVVGIDEVGRGSWAGPLMLGAAVVPQRPARLQDPRLEDADRARARGAVRPHRRAGASPGRSGRASQQECDELGMSDGAAAGGAPGHRRPRASQPDQVLLDGNWDFVGAANTRRIVKGDATCLSIAAASILAKVTRDRIMRGEAEHFPGYDFESQQGLPVPAPQDGAGRAWARPSIHRRSWVFMDHMPWTGIPRVRPPDPQLALFD